MGTIFQLIENKIQPVAGSKVIKASDYLKLIESNEVLDTAKENASKIIKDAEAVYEEQKTQGYMDGVMEGKLEHAEKIIETVLSSVEFIENIEKTLVDVVSSSIEKVLGEFSREELVVGIVRQALNTVRNQQKILIRVCPDDEKPLREALSLMIQNKKSGFIDIIADQRLKPTSCVLESDLGVIDASLETQLTALKQAFVSKIQN